MGAIPRESWRWKVLLGTLDYFGVLSKGTHTWTIDLFPPRPEKQLQVLQDIADLTVKASEQALFKCEVSDDKVTGKWYKDGVEVMPSERIKMTHEGR